MIICLDYLILCTIYKLSWRCQQIGDARNVEDSAKLRWCVNENSVPPNWHHLHAAGVRKYAAFQVAEFTASTVKLLFARKTLPCLKHLQQRMCSDNMININQAANLHRRCNCLGYWYKFHYGFQITPQFGIYSCNGTHMLNSHYSAHNSDVTFQLHCRQLWTSLRACACVCVCIRCVWRFILFAMNLGANSTGCCFLSLLWSCAGWKVSRNVSPVELWLERFDIKQTEVLINGFCVLLLCQIWISCTFSNNAFFRSGPVFKIITSAFHIFVGVDCNWSSRLRIWNRLTACCGSCRKLLINYYSSLSCYRRSLTRLNLAKDQTHKLLSQKKYTLPVLVSSATVRKDDLMVRDLSEVVNLCKSVYPRTWTCRRGTQSSRRAKSRSVWMCHARTHFQGGSG